MHTRVSGIWLLYFAVDGNLKHGMISKAWNVNKHAECNLKHKTWTKHAAKQPDVKLEQTDLSPAMNGIRTKNWQQITEAKTENSK